MTVIAYRDGIVAADSAAFNGDRRTGTVDKLTKLKDGSVLAMLGGLGEASRLAAWVIAGCKGEQPLGDEGAVVVFRRGGVIDIYEKGTKQIATRAPFQSFGAGADMAFGAMAAGATAEEAIAVACEHHVWCGLPVRAVAL